MERAFESAVSATPPTAPASPAIGYPRKGDPGTGTAPTKPGPWWYHMVTEEIRAVIVAGGLTPDQNNVTQMRDALITMYGAGRPGHTFTANDWCPLPSGLIVQWGALSAGTSVATFPLAFATVLRTFLMPDQNNTSAVIGQDLFDDQSGWPTRIIRVGTSAACLYIAIGY